LATGFLATVGFTSLERYELKYWVAPRLLAPVREHLGALLVREHAGPQQNVSLYLDTLDRAFYRAHIWGQSNRFKLRVRRYGSAQGEQVFAEVKRKVKDVVVKKRAVIAAADWAKVISPTGPVTDPHLEEFAYLLAVTGAAPQVIVACLRTAWVPRISVDSARVTLDEAIVGYPWRGAFFDLDPRWATAIDGADAHPGTGRQALLELKFTGGAPGWMRDLVQRFGLTRTAYSKFCAAMRVLDPLAASPLLTRTPLARAERRAEPTELASFPP
jgi:VTC domain